MGQIKTLCGCPVRVFADSDGDVRIEIENSLESYAFSPEDAFGLAAALPSVIRQAADRQAAKHQADVKLKRLLAQAAQCLADREAAPCALITIDGAAVGQVAKCQ